MENLNEFIEEYKKYLISQNLSTNTVSSYIYDVIGFVEYLNHNYSSGITETKKAQVLTYLVDMQKKGKSSSTISRTISSLKNIFEYLKKNKTISENPALSIHSPKQIKKIPVILSEEQINELMNIPNINTFKGSRDSAILELLYSSGIKVTELINLKISHVNINAGIINVEGSKERILPLSDISKEAIMNYLNNFRNIKSKEENEFLFINANGENITRQGIWKILKFYEKKLLNLNELSPQILRNSFAVHLLTHGADLRTVQELMGLSSLAATQSYINTVEIKSLDVFKKTFPRI